MSDFERWWQSQPFFTKWMLALALVFTLLPNFGVVSFYSLLFDTSAIFQKIEAWRLFTCFFCYGR